MSVITLDPMPEPFDMLEQRHRPPRLTLAPRPAIEQLRLFAHLPPVVPDPPGPTDIRRSNPRLQGEIGLADAIGFFGRRGLTVSIPLADNQAYDLLVELDGAVARVQVKTTTVRSPKGRFVVHLATRGGNQSFHTGKLFDRDGCDLVYALTDAGQRWVVPSADIRARTSMTLYERYDRFRVAADD